MKRRHRTLLLIILGASIIAIAAFLGMNAMKSTMSFFYSPQDIAQNPPKIGMKVRLGGLVENGSLKNIGDGKINFFVGDGIGRVEVEYQGIVPDLFREGQGVIAEGKFISADKFIADKILAKHDENYMPKEVADALKKSGQWKEYNASQAKTPANEGKK